MKTDFIEHDGIISEITSEKIKVRITSESACSNCHAKGGCSMSEKSDKIIEINKTDTDNFKIGQSVTVILKRSLGIKAVLLSYFLPFLILVGVMIITSKFTKSELIIGSLAIFSTLPYYMILFKLQEKISTNFKFRIKT